MSTNRNGQRAARRPRPVGPLERGSVSLELVVVAPGVLVILLLVLFGGRLALAHQAVNFAAAQAARQASLAADPGQGVAAGTATAQTALANQGLRCASSSTEVAAGALASPPGVAGSVRVELSCRAQLDDLGLPGAPGSLMITAAAEVPIDQWVAR